MQAKPWHAVAMLVFQGVLWSSAPVHAQTWPTKVVRIIVASSPGGPYDQTARTISPQLTRIWGHQVIIDNRAGAGGTIGATAAARAPADGYTMFLGNAGAMTVNPSLRNNLPYDPQKDFAPVQLISTSPMLLVVHPSMPVKSVRELVVLAKKTPGGLNYGSSGVGSLQHLTMEYLQTFTGTKMHNIPYKGVAPALVDLLTGQFGVMFANILGTMEHVQEGRLRAIAVSSAKRSAMLPDLPSVAETYPKFDVTTWMGLFLPSGTPREIIDRVGSDLAQVLQQPDMRKRFAVLGADVVAGPPEQLAEILRTERAMYTKLIKSIGLETN